MYIVACSKCGETKIISSEVANNGLTETYWSCPVCGSGQLIRLFNSMPQQVCNLRASLGGIGFPAEKEGYACKPLKKAVPFFEL